MADDASQSTAPEAIAASPCRKVATAGSAA